MNVRLAQEQEVEALTRMSKAAFDTDIHVGSNEVGGPPGYDSNQWHTNMLREGHLYSLVEKCFLMGGVLLFRDEEQESKMYLGRIFLSPQYHRKGYGLEAMRLLEQSFPDIQKWCLDTPIWNERTNQFYLKLGYIETGRDEEVVYYEKVIGKE